MSSQVDFLTVMIRTVMSTQTVQNMTSVVLEEQFRCCICLDVYTDPVSIPCGHNFCLDCIEGFWDTKDQSECPLCKETFKSRPDLRINRGFADVIEFLKRPLSAPNEEDVDAADPQAVELSDSDGVPCDICNGNKAPSVKSCLVCQLSYCDIHLMLHLRDPALQRHRLTDPATFPASHLCRNHNKPLTMFCKKDQMPVCTRCAERSHKSHSVVPLNQAGKRVKSSVKVTKANIQQMIQARLMKMDEIKTSVDLSKKVAEREIESSSEVCATLVSAIQTHQAGLVQELEERQAAAERRAEELLEQLEQEIKELQTRSSELQHLELTHNPLHLLQGFQSLSKLPPTREWSDVAVHSNNCLGTMRRTVHKLIDVCQEVINKLSAEEANYIKQYAVDVTLDPNTASGWLALSSDGKKVSCQMNKCSVPNNPQRFESCVCVLGKQSFTSGRRYWVVQVGGKTDWDLGVAKESINRKGAITVRPDSGYWAICRRRGGSLNVCTSPSIALHLQRTPDRVGVFLDYEEGSVSFYDAGTSAHIYTYSGCAFSEPMYPYFNPCLHENGKNSAPLVVCPMEGDVRSLNIETDL